MEISEQLRQGIPGENQKITEGGVLTGKSVKG